MTTKRIEVSHTIKSVAGVGISAKSPIKVHYTTLPPMGVADPTYPVGMVNGTDGVVFGPGATTTAIAFQLHLAQVWSRAPATATFDSAKLSTVHTGMVTGAKVAGDGSNGVEYLIQLEHWYYGTSVVTTRGYSTYNTVFVAPLEYSITKVKTTS